jgi:hypothetical protein
MKSIGPIPLTAEGNENKRVHNSRRSGRRRGSGIVETFPSPQFRTQHHPYVIRSAASKRCSPIFSPHHRKLDDFLSNSVQGNPVLPKEYASTYAALR